MAHRNDTTTALRIADIVRSNDANGLLARAGQLADLGARLSRVLPSSLSPQVRFANLRDGKLVFFATSPAWATRLRYAQGLILEAARQLGLDVHGMVVKVLPAAPAVAEQPPSKPRSNIAAEHLALAERLLFQAPGSERR